RLAEVRLSGQDAALTIEVTEPSQIEEAFRCHYNTVFGYEPSRDRKIEIVSYRAVAGTGRSSRSESEEDRAASTSHLKEYPSRTDFLDRASLPVGSSLSGARVIQDPFSTLFLKEGWTATVAPNRALILTRHKDAAATKSSDRPDQVKQELFRHRFDHLVVEMGSMLQRSAVSTNVKERADFSCALLDGDGELITSAPHIPVHLGALGTCVREVVKILPMNRGDVVITNHPGVGGSHLPDVTLITPIFADEIESPVAYIANRAHHAEIGGIRPGSMPPGATSLAEEGVVIPPTKLIERGASRFSEIEAILTEARFPTRNLRDNIADLNAQLASNRHGVSLFSSLIDEHGVSEVSKRMRDQKDRSRSLLSLRLSQSSFGGGSAEEQLDDGTRIAVSLNPATRLSEASLEINFAGTDPAHPTNFNATPAIVQSAILYVLRLWTGKDIPLNEGLLGAVSIHLPECFLNPNFNPDPMRSPAVVGGNVETSQRVVDCLIRAFELEACSQGTMNNFLFGDETFGYYETICGGSGAGHGYEGTGGIHTHMTNTAITDPEILEQRYPVRLIQFGLRANSGGNGMWKGGDGVIREFEFLAPLKVSILSQHRKVAPYGLDGGGNGQVGAQFLNGRPIEGITAIEVAPGDRIRLETPGGGGFGGAGALNLHQ
ncbi:MAG: hydantoinase B/oxoprolinase family protein, partial [Verrucomicrobiota bacterium]